MRKWSVSSARADLDDVIDWFRLDGTTVTEVRLNEAYRRIAKELHPDGELFGASLDHARFFWRSKISVRSIIRNAGGG